MKSLAFALILLLSFFGTNQSVWFSPIQAGMDEMNMLSAVSNLSENNKIIVTLLKSQGEKQVTSWYLADLRGCQG